jgi:CheY-like chemotaxis protein
VGELIGVENGVDEVADGRPMLVFVDDEPMLLTSLRRLLHRQRQVWEMYFVSSAAEALAFLQTHHVHLVVSDLRMPGMNGAELMEALRSRFPQVRRCTLTGEIGTELLAEALALSDVLLDKPCDGTMLRSTIAGLLSAGAAEGGR